MGFGALRVLNDDVIEPNSGFGMHSHADMEIVTIVERGTVTHADSMGNEAQVSAGEVQIMSAGTGVTHSEFNRSASETLELFQVWVYPRERGSAPRYGQLARDRNKEKNAISLVVSPEEGEGVLRIHQDAYFSLAHLDPGKEVIYPLYQSGNGVYLFVIEGVCTVAGVALEKRDAIGVWEADTVSMSTLSGGSFLFIEVPLSG